MWYSVMKKKIKFLFTNPCAVYHHGILITSYLEKRGKLIKVNKIIKIVYLNFFAISSKQSRQRLAK